MSSVMFVECTANIISLYNGIKYRIINAKCLQRFQLLINLFVYTSKKTEVHLGPSLVFRDTNIILDIPLRFSTKHSG